MQMPENLSEGEKSPFGSNQQQQRVGEIRKDFPRTKYEKKMAKEGGPRRCIANGPR